MTFPAFSPIYIVTNLKFRFFSPETATTFEPMRSAVAKRASFIVSSVGPYSPLTLQSPIQFSQNGKKKRPLSPAGALRAARNLISAQISLVRNAKVIWPLLCLPTTKYIDKRKTSTVACRSSQCGFDRSVLHDSMIATARVQPADACSILKQQTVKPVDGSGTSCAIFASRAVRWLVARRRPPRAA
jgi:hypothetical protein